MYLDHFGLKENPFKLTPDTEFFFNYTSHREALEVLRLALGEGEGFVKVTGEVGTGKTMLCRLLLNTLDRNRFVTAYIPNPYLPPEGLHAAFAEELELDLPPGCTLHHMVKAITGRLIELHEQGKQVALIVDEAQAMPELTLEAMRLMTNLETEKDKLLQVVLFGQSELNQRLAVPANRQILQRITFSYDLAPLDREGVAGYVAHRLTVAGYNGPSLFPRKAVDALHRFSGGIPRLVNTLGNKALMVAYGRGERSVTPRDVQLAAHDSAEQRAATPQHASAAVTVSSPPWAVLALYLIGLGMVAFAAGLFGLHRLGLLDGILLYLARH